MQIVGSEVVTLTVREKFQTAFLRFASWQISKRGFKKLHREEWTKVSTGSFILSVAVCFEQYLTPLSKVPRGSLLRILHRVDSTVSNGSLLLIAHFKMSKGLFM